LAEPLGAPALFFGVPRSALDRVRTAGELQTDEIDELYKVAIKRSLGYRLADDAGPGAGRSAFGHVGNGMFAFADLDRAIAGAFLRNSFASPPPGKLSAGDRVMAALSEALHETAPA
jgi:hypothetical protein